MTSDGSSSGDNRVRRSHAAVLAASVELLEDNGISGFSIDEVVRRSGVAKTTIYRHWPSRESLIVDACAQLDVRYATPDTGSLQGDLTAFLADLAHMLRAANWASVLPSIIDAAERDDEFAALHSQLQRGHAEPVREILERAVSRGEVHESVDTAVVVATLLGPLFYRRWYSREPLDDFFIESVGEQVVMTLERACGL